MKKSTIINILLILTMLGILTSTYLVKLHYSQSSSFCNINDKLNCDIVNKSQYALFPPLYGAPISLLGLLNFLILFLAIILISKNKQFSLFKEQIDQLVLSEFIYYALLANLLFAAYLIYIESFVLGVFCIICLLLDLIIILSIFFSYKLKKSS
ncbi:MAG: hypothetical protein US53_C0035G0013 [Candidatus Woesebacteria bacterium GW2011_GWA1_37_7]|uniref:Vitamin K epoxide reductase domain-containing protein n=1 Tax=Candidatus Woesebacteria bacterium GW2011_GWA1_37_7 TaxID=1618545 RepID=A0A0G0HE89_9BACT|nr:MAG: hypothetical protein US53_C0035G0013 [Candidatus Woesebacteria bacterium GW2011_GWA1_37_7]HLC63156.1 vitamin K epoxide reductase family protein [Candidatus Nanoarchaeia archaeon]